MNRVELAASPFVILTPTPDTNRVEAWSTERLPFEPTGWRRAFRDRLRAAVAMLRPEPGRPLSGQYAALDSRPCDAENVLFYNLGPGRFAPLTRSGLCFERLHAAPPAAPDGRAELPHYHRYEPTDADSDFVAWARGGVLAEWAALPFPTPMALSAPATVWWRLTDRLGRSGAPTSTAPDTVGLSMTLRTASGRSLNTAAAAKGLVDGVVSAFHRHTGEQLEEASRRVAAALGEDPSAVARRLADGSRAVLGPRRFLWTRQAGVQWSPADDWVVAWRYSSCRTRWRRAGCSAAPFSR